MNNGLNIIDCGLADYNAVLDKQLKLREQRQNNEISDTVLLVEHKTVITLGARKSANKFNLDIEELKSKGIDIVDIRRGGGVTAHNHGQLVIYPIINIKQRSLGINEYVRTLEQIGIELLNELGIQAERLKGFPGLWVNEKKKIASIGVRVSKGITYHGMAININNDLSIFDYMIPCGLDNVEMISVLKETDKNHSMNHVKNITIEILRKYFT